MNATKIKCWVTYLAFIACFLGKIPPVCSQEDEPTVPIPQTQQQPSPPTIHTTDPDLIKAEQLLTKGHYVDCLTLSRLVAQDTQIDITTKSIAQWFEGKALIALGETEQGLEVWQETYQELDYKHPVFLLDYAIETRKSDSKKSLALAQDCLKQGPYLPQALQLLNRLSSSEDYTSFLQGYTKQYPQSSWVQQAYIEQLAQHNNAKTAEQFLTSLSPPLIQELDQILWQRYLHVVETPTKPLEENRDFTQLLKDKNEDALVLESYHQLFQGNLDTARRLLQQHPDKTKTALVSSLIEERAYRQAAQKSWRYSILAIVVFFSMLVFSLWKIIQSSWVQRKLKRLDTALQQAPRKVSLKDVFSRFSQESLDASQLLQLELNLIANSIQLEDGTTLTSYNQDQVDKLFKQLARKHGKALSLDNTKTQRTLKKYSPELLRYLHSQNVGIFVPLAESKDFNPIILGFSGDNQGNHKNLIELVSLRYLTFYRILQRQASSFSHEQSSSQPILTDTEVNSQAQESKTSQVIETQSSSIAEPAQKLGTIIPSLIETSRRTQQPLTLLLFGPDNNSLADFTHLEQLVAELIKDYDEALLVKFQAGILAILLPAVGIEEALSNGEKIRTMAEKKLKQWSTTVSCGIAVYPSTTGNQVTPEEFLESAYKAYSLASKERNAIYCASPES